MPLYCAETSPPLDPGQVIYLDRLRIDERGLGRPFVYTEIPGYEILSPFSEKITAAYAKELQRQRAMLANFIPEIEAARCDQPQAIFLDDQPPVENSTVWIGESYAMDDGVVRQSVDAMRGVKPQGRKPPANGPRSLLSWSRARGSDSCVYYTSIYGSDPYVRQEGKSITTADRAWSHIFPLAAAYEFRRPQWPEWVEDGIDVLGARFFAARSLQIFLLRKVDPPPHGLSVDQVFNSGEAGGFNAALRAQFSAVFITWALTGPDARRDRFWHFASRASHEPVTENLFTQTFGAEAWEEMVSFWTRTSYIQKNPRYRTPVPLRSYEPDAHPVVVNVTIRKATRAELVRIRSEYEWRIGREFLSAAPEFARQCLAQAGWRMRKAYEDGERDPKFVALLALYEVETGASTHTRSLIEQASAARVSRPAIYYHQSRLRSEEERAALANPEAKLTLVQTRRILEPLETACTIRPAMVEIYQAMTEAWDRCESLPTPADLERLYEGMSLFPRQARLASNVALLHARAGNAAKARTILAAAIKFTTEGTELHRRLRDMRAAIDQQLAPSKLHEK